MNTSIPFKLMTITTTDSLKKEFLKRFSISNKKKTQLKQMLIEAIYQQINNQLIQPQFKTIQKYGSIKKLQTQDITNLYKLNNYESIEICNFLSILGSIFLVIYRQSYDKGLGRWWRSFKIAVLAAAIAAGLIPNSTKVIEPCVPNNPPSIERLLSKQEDYYTAASEKMSLKVFQTPLKAYLNPSYLFLELQD